VEIKDVKEEAAHEVALAKRQWPRQKLQRRWQSQRRKGRRMRCRIQLERDSLLRT
jgi:hypothetical protein